MGKGSVCLKIVCLIVSLIEIGVAAQMFVKGKPKPSNKVMGSRILGFIGGALFGGKKVNAFSRWSTGAFLGAVGAAFVVSLGSLIISLIMKKSKMLDLILHAVCCLIMLVGVGIWTVEIFKFFSQSSKIGALMLFGMFFLIKIIGIWILSIILLVLYLMITCAIKSGGDGGDRDDEDSDSSRERGRGRRRSSRDRGRKSRRRSRDTDSSSSD